MSPTTSPLSFLEKIEYLCEAPFVRFAEAPSQVDPMLYILTRTLGGKHVVALTELDLILLDSIFATVERRIRNAATAN